MRAAPILVVGLALTAAPVRSQQIPAEKEKPKFTSSQWAAARQDPKRFQIDPKSIEVKEIDAKTLESILPPKGDKPGEKPAIGIPGGSGGGVTPPIGGGGGGEDPIVFLDRIVNLANKIWKIIKENEPTVETKTAYANAVPDGIDHWSRLGGWGLPKTKTYGFYAKNMYGSKTIEVIFQVIRQDGGNYQGKGKYLNGVQVQPLKVSASWGYKFTMDATMPTVTNVGTSEDPVAGLMARLNWSIHTAIKHEEGTHMYFMQGDGLFKEIGDPFKYQKTGRAEQLVKKLSEKLEKGASWE